MYIYTRVNIYLNICIYVYLDKSIYIYMQQMIANDYKITLELHTMEQHGEWVQDQNTPPNVRAHSVHFWIIYDVDS